MNKINVLLLCCFILFCCNKGETPEKNQEKTSEYSKQNESQEETFKHSKQDKTEGKTLNKTRQHKNVKDNYYAILGTKWISPLILNSGKIVFDSLIFKTDCTSVHYSCEDGTKNFGKFYLNGDTVIVKSNVTYYSDNKTYKHVFKLLLFNDTLRPVYAKFGYQDPKTEFDSTYIFYKDTNTVLEEGNE